MFVLDLLKTQQQKLRVIAAFVAGGLVILLGGLWVVQVVASKRFSDDLQKQSFRTVRVSAIRGRILDRNGEPLAENRPCYNAVVYLEELRDRFDNEFEHIEHAYVRAHPEVVSVKHKIKLNEAIRNQLHSQADYSVVSNLTWNTGAILESPRLLNPRAFLQHYASYPYVPFQILPNLQPKQVAIFAEQLSSQPALELETQPVRSYPHGSLAAHLLGYVTRKDEFDDDEFACQYRLPDYQGKTGIEGIFDDQLRGQPGVRSVLVNNRGYRQSEQTLTPSESGNDISLTIDASVQDAAEKGLAQVVGQSRGGAVVVMDVRNGDILAMASAPTFDPNEYVAGIPDVEWARLTDKEHTPQLNRAIDGAYPPGSTFKIITAIACLESGLDPNAIYDSPGEFVEPGYHRIADLAPAGPYDLKRALYRSSNTYFIHFGLMAGLPKILSVARRFHLGEKTQVEIHPEVKGNVPNPQDVGTAIHTSSTPDVCIGQEVTVSPLQMAVMTSAIANGGTIFWPRLVRCSISPETGEQHQITAPGRVRDHVTLNQRQLDIIREAMLEDTERGTPGDAGTAYIAFHYGDGNRLPILPDFHVAGKTGTAQVDRSDKTRFHDTWFVSFAPYENPRYAVVVMVDHGNFGGDSCAPVACRVYGALIKSEHAVGSRGGTLAEAGGR